LFSTSSTDGGFLHARYKIDVTIENTSILRQWVDQSDKRRAPVRAVCYLWSAWNMDGVIGNVKRNRTPKYSTFPHRCQPLGSNIDPGATATPGRLRIGGGCEFGKTGAMVLFNCQRSGHGGSSRRPQPSVKSLFGEGFKSLSKIVQKSKRFFKSLIANTMRATETTESTFCFSE
jgi:hypothetical protein